LFSQFFFFFLEVYIFCADVSGVSPARFRVPRKEAVEFFLDWYRLFLRIARKAVIRPFVLNFSACILLSEICICLLFVQVEHGNC
jgi:hypothetical protein